MPLRTSRRIQAVTFDLDGTLYNRDAHVFRVGWRLLRHRKVLMAWQEAVAALRGSRHPDLKGEALRQMSCVLGRPVEEIGPEIDFVLQDIFSRGLQPTHVPAGILESLRLVDGHGVPRLVASDHPPKYRLECLGLSDGWLAILSGEELGAFKPLPDVLLEAVARAGVRADQLLHVGDREDTDGEAARAIGATFLQVGGAGVSWSRLPQMLEGLLES